MLLIITQLNPVSLNMFCWNKWIVSQGYKLKEGPSPTLLLHISSSRYELIPCNKEILSQQALKPQENDS